MISYTISKPEAYGCAGDYGNKYWVRVYGGSQDEIEEMLKHVLKTCKNEKVVFPGFSGVRAMEVTFFIYTESEKEQGVDIADLVYEWDEKEGLVKSEGGGDKQ